MGKKNSTSTEVPSSIIKGNNCASSNVLRSADIASGEDAPRFLIVKRTADDFNKVSPFLIAKEVANVLGKVSNVSKIREGLLIETASYGQSLRLLQIRKLCGYDVTVAPHRTLNYSKGVIRCSDLLVCSVEEIKEELRAQGVIDVRNISTRVDGMSQPSPSYILTFNSPKLPLTVKAGYISLNVRPFIPSPLRCFRCQRFGHVSTKCNKEQRCSCGSLPHPDAPCTLPPSCVNCGLGHSARSKECRIYKEEASIQRLKVTENLTYAEARRKVQSSNLISNKSFAEVAARKSSQSFDSIAKDLAKALMPEIISMFESSTRHQSRKPKESGKPSRNQKPSLQNPIPTSVLLSKEKRSTGNTPSNPPPADKKQSSVAKPTETPTTSTDWKSMELEADAIVHAIINRGRSFSSPTASGNEGYSSIRERSSSSSPSSKPPKKKALFFSREHNSDSNSDTEQEMFTINREAKPSKKPSKMKTGNDQT